MDYEDDPLSIPAIIQEIKKRAEPTNKTIQCLNRLITDGYTKIDDGPVSIWDEAKTIVAGTNEARKIIKSTCQSVDDTLERIAQMEEVIQAWKKNLQEIKTLSAACVMLPPPVIEGDYSHGTDS